MYLLYVDESGDPGKATPNSSKHFILSGFIIHSNEWWNKLQNFHEYRKKLKEQYRLSTRTEIHAAELIRISKTKEYRKIHKSKRIEILKGLTENIPKIFADSKIINICFDKSEFNYKNGFQELAWSRMIQRYETFLRFKNSKGIILSDDTNEKLVRNLIRKMRHYNPLPDNRNEPIRQIIEDIFMKQSEHSYFIQIADVIAHSLYRHEFPKSSLKKYNVDKLFLNFDAILLKKACKSDEFGIVRK